MGQEGLLHVRSKDVQCFQRKFLLSEERLEAWKDFEGSNISLENVVEAVKPTVLIGTSAQHGAFTESIVRKMSSAVERPIIFPLSNPTSQCEADPADLIAWSEGEGDCGNGEPILHGSITRVNQSRSVNATIVTFFQELDWELLLQSPNISATRCLLWQPKH